MTTGGSEYLGMYITIGYTLLSMALGAALALKKHDFASRGAAVSMFAGLFGPLFMLLEAPSQGREGGEEIWPARGPEAVVLNIVLVAVFNYFV